MLLFVDIFRAIIYQMQPLVYTFAKFINHKPSDLQKCLDLHCLVLKVNIFVFL
jgi:hypothetical protein